MKCHTGGVAELVYRTCLENKSPARDREFESHRLRRKKLRRARLEANLTQVEAGKRLKKPQAYLSKIERGERGIDAVELGELAKVYRKPLDYFIKQ